jgi:hypothetical protein
MSGNLERIRQDIKLRPANGVPSAALDCIARALDSIMIARDHVEREAREHEQAVNDARKREDEERRAHLKCGACARIGTNDTRPMAHARVRTQGGQAVTYRDGRSSLWIAFRLDTERKRASVGRAARSRVPRERSGSHNPKFVDTIKAAKSYVDGYLD